METIEKVVETEALKYPLGAEHFARLLTRIAEKGEKLGTNKDANISNIREIGEITRFCSNPYKFLINLTEAYEKSREVATAQGIIDSFYMTYKSKRRAREDSRFTEEDIETALYVLTEESLRII